MAHQAARVIAALAVAADLVFLLQTQVGGLLPRPLGTWSSFILFDLAPVLAMAAFPTLAGGCPVDFTRLSAPGQSPECYRPLGAPVTITSAAVEPGPTAGPASPSNAPPSEYGLLIALPAAGRTELTAVTTEASESQGAVDISVIGKTWGLPMTQVPITNGWFTIMLPSQNEVLQLQRILTASD
jgi:hypothetical protein